MQQGDHLFLVDGSAYIFRAYHALPPLSRKSDGLPIGAVAGFCNMLWKLLREARDTSVGVVPTHFAVIFDHSSTTFRNEIYPEYKANRDAPPEDLRPQFGVIRQATHAFNVPCIEKEGFEADDLIATYAKEAVAAGGDVTIISSDKDLMQLINDNVIMYDTMKDRRVGSEEVFEKFGVGPDMMIDLQSLAGDSTDNIPGVPGIGPKTAAQLLEEFGDLETLLERAGEIKQNKRRENLIEFADQARISKKLVTLDQNTPLDVPLSDLALEPVNGPKLIAFLKGIELNTLTRRVASETETDAAEIEPDSVEVDGFALRGPDLDSADDPLGDDKSSQSANGEMAFSPANLVETITNEIGAQPVDTSAYETVRSKEALDRWIDEARSLGYVAVDTETDSLDAMQANLVGVSLATLPGKACYIPVGHITGEDDLLGGGLAPDQLDTRTVLDALKPLLEDASVLKIAQNMKYDWLLLSRFGIEMAPFDDTMLLSYVLDAGRSKHGRK